MDSQPYQWQQDQYIISTDKALLDRPFVHAYLTRSTWAKGISPEVVNTSINNSLCFGLYDNEKQIGFTRLVTDLATFGYLCDVFIIEEYQGKGLARWMLDTCLEHPTLLQLRRIMLVTSTAAGLYEKIGYSAVNDANFVWQINRPNIYSRQ